MITQKAKYKAKVLAFREKHGLEATTDAFPVKRSTLFLWKKKLRENQGKLISLNDKKRIPKNTRKREWPFEIRQKIKEIRHNPLHPNLGPDKIYPLLKTFCRERGLKCPGVRTVTRVIADDQEKMFFYLNMFMIPKMEDQYLLNQKEQIVLNRSALISCELEDLLK